MSNIHPRRSEICINLKITQISNTRVGVGAHLQKLTNYKLQNNVSYTSHRYQTERCTGIGTTTNIV